MTPDGMHGWIHTLTPIMESRAFAMILMLGFGVFLYFTCHAALERHRITIETLFAHTQALHKEHVDLVRQAGKCTQ